MPWFTQRRVVVATCSLTMLLGIQGDVVTSAEPAVMRIERDTVLDPERRYGPLVIAASGITIDGRGAEIVGLVSTERANYQGTGIFAQGVSEVTLKNVRVKGWERGLHVVDGEKWIVEGCDFSDNFHDPSFGWGENGRRGGIVWERVHRSILRNCRANRVWDACVLVDSNHNQLEHNDFSHTSNTCLKLWHASHNVVRDNQLRYGIRKDPGEVHARDSTCVLIESGSDGNRFLRNDCRYGGDGIFIRVLNGWVSTGNYFEENDCSYANNNCVEAWSPENTWVRNKANHGSYGFWLGASDKNTLIDNEASHNGLADGNHNSPHLPDRGHAGIVFMFGPSSHTILRGNRCEGNNGAGIAAIGDLASGGQAWNAFHWIVEQNALIGNRWGIFLQHAEMIDLAGNRFQGNSVADVFQGDGVGFVRQRLHVDASWQPPKAVLRGPSVAVVDQPVVFDASESTARQPEQTIQQFHWRVQPDGSFQGPQWQTTFRQPGFHRLALTVNDGVLSDLAWRDLYVVSPTPEFATGDALETSWTGEADASEFLIRPDREHRLVGESSVHATIDPYDGGPVWLVYRVNDAAPSLRDADRLAFWLKLRNPHVPAWQDKNPRVILQSSAGRKVAYEPTRDLLATPPYNEAREGWSYFSIPLAGDATWQRSGEPLDDLATLKLGFDSWGAPPLDIWIDGITLETD